MRRWVSHSSIGSQLVMTSGYNLRSGGVSEMEPDQSGGLTDVGSNAEMTRVTGEPSGGSGSDQMAMLQMQLRITEMELAMERLRNNSASAAANAENAEAARSEDGRLRYTSLLKDVLVPMPTQGSLVPSWFDDVEATFD